jgi:hypothetical protein
MDSFFAFIGSWVVGMSVFVVFTWSVWKICERRDQRRDPVGYEMRKQARARLNITGGSNQNHSSPY